MKAGAGFLFSGVILALFWLNFAHPTRAEAQAQEEEYVYDFGYRYDAGGKDDDFYVFEVPLPTGLDDADVWSPPTTTTTSPATTITTTTTASTATFTSPTTTTATVTTTQAATESTTQSPSTETPSGTPTTAEEEGTEVKYPTPVITSPDTTTTSATTTTATATTTPAATESATQTPSTETPSETPTTTEEEGTEAGGEPSQVKREDGSGTADSTNDPACPLSREAVPCIPVPCEPASAPSTPGPEVPEAQTEKEVPPRTPGPCPACPDPEEGGHTRYSSPASFTGTTVTLLSTFSSPAVTTTVTSITEKLVFRTKVFVESAPASLRIATLTLPPVTVTSSAICPTRVTTSYRTSFRAVTLHEIYERVKEKERHRVQEMNEWKLDRRKRPINSKGGEGGGGGGGGGDGGGGSGGGLEMEGGVRSQEERDAGRQSTGAELEELRQDDLPDESPAFRDWAEHVWGDCQDVTLVGGGVLALLVIPCLISLCWCTFSRRRLVCKLRQLQELSPSSTSSAPIVASLPSPSTGPLYDEPFHPAGIRRSTRLSSFQSRIPPGKLAASPAAPGIPPGGARV